MAYPQFDPSRLKLKPLAERVHDYPVSGWAALDDPVPSFASDDLRALAQAIVAARRAERPFVWMMGAHVVKYGLSRYIVDLMERGLITGVAYNGACCIHDFEAALIGATSESVARYISEGQFGLWLETGRLNDLARTAADESIGFGEAVGRVIEREAFRYRDSSILAAGYRLGIPVTVHVSLGYDIIHEHPNCDGAALGAASYTDFLVFARQIESLEGGVLCSVGTAIMGPEVYLKALSMARNVAFQEGRSLCRFATAVFDLQPLGDTTAEVPRSDPRYYFRPFKTILVRTVADGGSSHFINADHKVSIPNLYRLILEAWQQ